MTGNIVYAIMESKETKAMDLMVAEGPVAILSPEGGFSGEAEYVRQEIMARKQDTWAEFAVLYRTNAQSAMIERELIKHRVPYTIKGGASFFARKEVYQMFFFLAAAWCNNLQAVVGYPKDRTRNIPGFQGIGNLPTLAFGKTTRYLGVASFNKLDMIFKSTPDPDMLQVVREWVRTMDSRSRPGANDLGDMIQNLRAAANSPVDALNWAFVNVYEKQLRLDTGDDQDNYDAKVASVNVLMEIAQEYESIPEFVNYCVERMLASSSTKDEKDSVKLMTIHASKGLEFRNVFVLGCCEGLLPHAMGDLREELRLFYVAVTRAMDHLTLSSPVGLDFKGRELVPSSFLDVLNPLD